MFAEHKRFQIAPCDAGIDHRALVTAIVSAQAASPTAVAQVHHDVVRNIADRHKDALATLMRARRGWQAAAGMLEGSFHPGVAGLINANRL